MNHIPRKNLFCVSFLSIYLLTAPVVGQKPASQPASRPARVKITISRKTTYVLGPLNADGTVNYVAAINKMYSKGVTPKNNAAIPLIKALGPEVLDEKFRSQILKALKMPPLPKKSDYFVSFCEYTRHHDSKGATYEQLDALRHKAQTTPFSSKDFPVVAEWLKVNEKPLNAIVAATKRPRYFVPWVSDFAPPKLEDGLMRVSWVKLKYAARALICRAMLKSAKGQAASARADLLAVHRLAHLVAQGPTFIDRLVATSIEVFACSGGTTLATSGRLTAAQAKAHLVDIQALPPLSNLSDVMDKGERLFGLDQTNHYARVGIREAVRPQIDFFKNMSLDDPVLLVFSFWNQMSVEDLPDCPLDWDEMLRLENQLHDRLMQAYRKPTFAGRKKALASIEDQLKKVVGQTIKQRVVFAKSISRNPDRHTPAGRLKLTRNFTYLMQSLSAPVFSRAPEMADRIRMQQRVTEVALALAACKAEKGKYPEKLAVLKPHYLKKIPTDLFIEKPLHYKRTGEGYLLYSVGPDMKDDGGKGRDDGKDCDDIVVKTKRDTETQRLREKK